MAYYSQYVLLENGHQDEPLPSADRLPVGRQGWDAVLLAPFLHFSEQICSLECSRRKGGHTQKDSAQSFLPGACRRDLGMPMWLPALQRPHFNSPGQESHGIDCVCIPFYSWANGNQPGKISLRSWSSWVEGVRRKPNTFIRQSAKSEISQAIWGC